MDSDLIILPGIGGSGDEHWQQIWKRRGLVGPDFEPASWEHPDLDDWIGALECAVNKATQPPVLVAHSLACLLVAHWAARDGRGVAGAFLVAVPDPKGRRFPRAAATFIDVPAGRLPFPALVVASADDPYGGLDHGKRRAADWGAGFVVVGAVGHINGDSGLGDWPIGAGLLEAFCAGAAARRRA